MAITDCALTIIDQIGGAGRLQVMLGTKHIVCDDEAITFDFKGSRKMNRCKIAYCRASDLYSVEFLKYSPKKLTFSKVQNFAGIYADQLRNLFESTTGLYLQF